MKTLNLQQMENVKGGDRFACAASGVGLAATFAAAFFIATPVGAAIFAVGFISGSISLGRSC